MRFSLKLLITIVCSIICFTCVYTSECYAENSDDRIDSFIRVFKLHMLESEDAERDIHKKGLKKESGDNGTFYSITAFDVSEDGEVAIAVTTGLHSGAIRVYDKDMLLKQSFSYQYNNGVDFIMLENGRLCFTGHKFHGVYVIDLNTDSITAYEWSDYELIRTLYESNFVESYKERNGTHYFLSNSKMKKPSISMVTRSYRYLITERGNDKRVIIDSGNTKTMYFACMIILFLLVAFISIRKWMVELRRINKCASEDHLI